MKRPIIGQTYFSDSIDDGNFSTYCNVAAISDSHVVCADERVFTRQEFAEQFMTHTDPIIGIYEGRFIGHGICKDCN